MSGTEPPGSEGLLSHSEFGDMEPDVAAEIPGAQASVEQQMGEYPEEAIEQQDIPVVEQQRMMEQPEAAIEQQEIPVVEQQRMMEQPEEATEQQEIPVAQQDEVQESTEIEMNDDGPIGSAIAIGERRSLDRIRRLSEDENAGISERGEEVTPTQALRIMQQLQQQQKVLDNLKARFAGANESEKRSGTASPGKPASEPEASRGETRARTALPVKPASDPAISVQLNGSVKAHSEKAFSDQMNPLRTSTIHAATENVGKIALENLMKIDLETVEMDELARQIVQAAKVINHRDTSEKMDDMIMTEIMQVVQTFTGEDSGNVIKIMIKIFTIYNFDLQENDSDLMEKDNKIVQMQTDIIELQNAYAEQIEMEGKASENTEIAMITNDELRVENARLMKENQRLLEMIEQTPLRVEDPGDVKTQSVRKRDSVYPQIQAEMGEDNAFRKPEIHAPLGVSGAARYEEGLVNIEAAMSLMPHAHGSYGQVPMPSPVDAKAIDAMVAEGKKQVEELGYNRTKSERVVMNALNKTAMKHNRKMLALALKEHTFTAVIHTYSVMYAKEHKRLRDLLTHSTTATATMAQKGLENAQKGSESDQDILMALAREVLGGYKQEIKAEIDRPRCDADGYEHRIASMKARGFISMNIAITLLVKPSVTDSSKQLRDILSLPEYMEKMVGGDLNRYISNLNRMMDEFQAINGLLTPKLVVKMLVMETILTSKHPILVSWRDFRMKESKWKHDINDPAIMHDMYDEYVDDAIRFMRAHKDYAAVATYKAITLAEAKKIKGQGPTPQGTAELSKKKVAMLAALVKRYEKDLSDTNAEIATFFIADSQEACKSCGRKHPTEVGCTRRTLLESTLQKLAPLAVQVKTVREAQNRLQEGKTPTTAQTKAVEAAAKTLEEILDTIKNPPKTFFKSKPGKVSFDKGPRSDEDKEKLKKTDCYFWLKGGVCTGCNEDQKWCPYAHIPSKAGSEPNKASPFPRRERTNVAILERDGKIAMIADSSKEQDEIERNDAILAEALGGTAPQGSMDIEYALVAEIGIPEIELKKDVKGLDPSTSDFEPGAELAEDVFVRETQEKQDEMANDAILTAALEELKVVGLNPKASEFEPSGILAQTEDVSTLMPETKIADGIGVEESVKRDFTINPIYPTFARMRALVEAQMLERHVKRDFTINPNYPTFARARAIVAAQMLERPDTFIKIAISGPMCSLDMQKTDAGTGACDGAGAGISGAETNHDMCDAITDTVAQAEDELMDNCGGEMTSEEIHNAQCTHTILSNYLRDEIKTQGASHHIAVKTIEMMKIVEAEMKTLWKDPLKEEILFETALIRVMEELLKDKEALAGIVRSESELVEVKRIMITITASKWERFMWALPEGPVQNSDFFDDLEQWQAMSSRMIAGKQERAKNDDNRTPERLPVIHEKKQRRNKRVRKGIAKRSFEKLLKDANDMDMKIAMQELFECRLYAMMQADPMQSDPETQTSEECKPTPARRKRTIQTRRIHGGIQLANITATNLTHKNWWYVERTDVKGLTPGLKKKIKRGYSDGWNDPDWVPTLMNIKGPKALRQLEANVFDAEQIGGTIGILKILGTAIDEQAKADILIRRMQADDDASENVDDQEEADDAHVTHDKFKFVHKDHHETFEKWKARLAVGGPKSKEQTDACEASLPAETHEDHDRNAESVSVHESTPQESESRGRENLRKVKMITQSFTAILETSIWKLRTPSGPGLAARARVKAGDCLSHHGSNSPGRAWTWPLEQIEPIAEIGKEPDQTTTTGSAQGRELLRDNGSAQGRMDMPRYTHPTSTVALMKVYRAAFQWNPEIQDYVRNEGILHALFREHKTEVPMSLMLMEDNPTRRHLLMTFSAMATNAMQDGVILHLVDSGSTCPLTPHRSHMYAPGKTDALIKGVGSQQAIERSPVTYAFLTTNLTYEIITLTAGYLMPSLGFPIFPSGKAEDQNWEFILNKDSSRVITSKGEVIPLLRDDATGFHWLVERPRARPAMQMKKKTIAKLISLNYTFSRQPDEILMTDAEESPTKPDIDLKHQLGGQSKNKQLQESMHLGQVEKCEASGCENPQAKNTKYCSERCRRADDRSSRQEGNATLEKAMQDRPLMRPRHQKFTECRWITCMCQACKQFKLADGEWNDAAKCIKIYHCKCKQCRRFFDDDGLWNDARASWSVSRPDGKIKLVTDDVQEIIPVSKIIPPQEDETVTDDVQEITPVSKIIPPQKQETEKSNTQAVTTSDAQYFKKMEIEKLRRAARLGKVIQLKMPQIKLLDTGSPEEIQKMELAIHHLCGHIGDATLLSASKYVDGLEILGLMKAAGSSTPHCEACAEDSRLPPIPKQKTNRPVRTEPHKILFIDMSGMIEETSIHNGFSYYLLAISETGFTYVYALAFKNQALFLISRLFADSGGPPDGIQIDKAGEFISGLARKFFDSKVVNTRIVDGGLHYPNGKPEKRHDVIKSRVRRMLSTSGLSPQYWWHAVKHAVLIMNLLLQGRDDQTGALMGKSIWECHYGVRPKVTDYLIGGFGCLAYLVLTNEQRNQRGLSSFWGIRAIPGIYLGSWVNPRTLVFHHLITDGHTVFTSPTRIRTVPDVYPLNMGIPRNPTSKEHALMASFDDGQVNPMTMMAVVFNAVVVNDAEQKESKKEKLGEETVFVGKIKERLTADEFKEEADHRVRPSRIVYDSMKKKPDATNESLFREVEDKNAEVSFEMPEDFNIHPAPDEMEIIEPYENAKYGIGIMKNFQTQVERKATHPHLRFIGREVRKKFEISLAGRVTVWKVFNGKVKSYSEDRALFKIKFEDDDREEWDFEELKMNLVMSKKHGDQSSDHGVTRAEQQEKLQEQALHSILEEESLHCRIPTDKQVYGKDDEDPEMLHSIEHLVMLGIVKPDHPVPDVVKYDDEPRSHKEVLKHEEREAIESAAAIEVKQMEDMDIGVFATDDDVKEFQKGGGKVLNTKMVYRRKYEIDERGVEKFKKWKARLSVVGTGEIGGIDTPFKVFSPTIGFAAIRSLISLTCGSEYDTRSFDLAGAFLKTVLLDRAVYVRLPADCGHLGGKVVRLIKSVYGLRTSNSDFYKALSNAILSFEKKSETKTDLVEEEKKDKDGRMRTVKTLVKRTYRFRRLITDHCIYVYEDDDGNRILIGHYVDDLIIATTNPELREEFLEHLRKSWDITDEGVLSRFLGTHFSRNRETRTWKMSMESYVDRIVRRFELQETKFATTPMEHGFKLEAEDIEEVASEEMISEYRSLIGSIGYCCIALRYDCMVAFSVLSRYLAKPCAKLIKAAKRVIQYLRYTRDFNITWTITDNDIINQRQNVLFGAVDASFAMDEINRRSHMGFINFMNHGPVSWMSRQQPIVTLSSAEAEYVALASEIQEIKYLRQLLKDLGYEQMEPTLIYEDNRACILMASNESSSAGRCKHVHIKFRFTAEAILAKEVRIRYIPTDFNFADLLTKPLVHATFNRILELCQNLKDSNGIMILAEEPPMVNTVNHDSFLVYLPGVAYGM